VRSRCFFRPAASSAEDLDLTGIFSNYGPVNTRFESAFGGGGRGSGGTCVALPRWPYPGRPRGVGAITENLIGVPAVHLLAASGGRTSSINRSFARLNGLTNLTLCKMNLRERQPPLGVRPNLNTAVAPNQGEHGRRGWPYRAIKPLYEKGRKRRGSSSLSLSILVTLLSSSPLRSPEWSWMGYLLRSCCE
jgi:hypothetical protein